MKLSKLKHPVIPSSLSTALSAEYGVTDVRVEHLTYEWAIKHFSLLPQSKNKFLVSPIFNTEEEDVQWNLRLYPQGDGSKNYVSLYLFLYAHKDPGIRIKVRWNISIIKSDTVILKKAYNYTYKEIIGYGNRKFVKRSDLLKIISPDDTFTIRAEIELMGTITKPLFLTQSLEQELSRESEQLEWNENFSHLLENPELSDVFVLAADEKFFAHEKILAARSSVFAKIFEGQELKENGLREVKIDGLEPIVVKAMLEFIYTDDVVDLDKLPFALLEAADIFKLQRLKIMCQIVLYKILDDDNAVDILTLTDFYHCYKLKEHVLKYIAEHFSAVMKTKGYKRLKETSGNLSRELMRTVRYQNSEIGFDKLECESSSHLYRTTLMISPIFNRK